MGNDESCTYWAAEEDTKKAAIAAQDHFGRGIDILAKSGRLDSAGRLLSAYYGRGADGLRDTTRLVDGEVTEWTINGVRPIVTTALGIVAGRRPAVKPRARNADSRSLAQTRLASALLDNYTTEAQGHELELSVVRNGMLASSWCLGQAWAPRDGSPYGVDAAGVVQYDGDIQEFTLPPWRVVFDFAASHADLRRWCVFVRPQPRWELAAAAEASGNKDVAEKIKRGGGSATLFSAGFSRPTVGTARGVTGTSLSSLETLMGEALPDDEVCWVWEMRHRPTPALPDGRVLRFVDPDCVLYSGAYPYAREDLHVYEYTPERVGAGTSGHTGMFDLLGGQEFMDMCTTSIATTANLCGNVHLWTPDRDSNPTVTKLQSGPTLLSTPTRPEVVDFPALKAEMVQAADWAQSQMRLLAALNDVVMGQPEKGMPASAQALQRAQAVEFHQVSQAAYLRLVQRSANGKLRMLKRFAKTPRIAQVAGVGAEYEVREWSAEDISDVERFDVEPINPMSQSNESRMAIAEMLLQQGSISSSEDLLTFVQTGSLPKITETATKDNEIAERLQQQLISGYTLPPVDPVASAEAGEVVFAEGEPGGKYLTLLACYPHHLIIRAFRNVVNSTTEPEVMRAGLEAIHRSLDLWQSLSPAQCQAYEIPQMAVMPPEPGLETADGLDAELGQPQQAEPPIELPSPPDDPITGEAQQSSM